MTNSSTILRALSRQGLGFGLKSLQTHLLVGKPRQIDGVLEKTKLTFLHSREFTFEA